jgi:hypothetical protein
VWRKPGEELRENNFLLPVKYGGGSVMEASGLVNLHLLEGILNKHVHMNVIREYLKASAEKLGFKNILHFTTTITQTFCTFGEGVVHVQLPKGIKTPPHSPDLNVNEISGLKWKQK